MEVATTRVRLDPIPPHYSWLGDVDIATSPEWFGDGLEAFRQVLVRRQLAEIIAAASPKDFLIREVT